MSQQPAPNMIEPANAGQEGMLNVTSARDMQEVQASIFLARQFPRDYDRVMEQITKACKRYGLAEQAMFAYKRGGQLVTGPSIRLAEAIAQSYQNLNFGIRELRQEENVSIVQAYAWDMENNVRQEKIFKVPHKRKTKRGSYTLDDPRDIYELTANMGARRMRACILSLIPGDIVELAVNECEKTLKGGNKEPLGERVKKLVTAFQELGVTEEMLTKRLGHNIDATTSAEFVSLYKIYRSIKDGFEKPPAFFEMKTKETGAAADLNSEFVPGDAYEGDEAKAES